MPSAALERDCGAATSCCSDVRQPCIAGPTGARRGLPKRLRGRARLRQLARPACAWPASTGPTRLGGRFVPSCRLGSGGAKELVRASPAALRRKGRMRIKMLKKWRSAGQNWANKCITVGAADGGRDRALERGIERELDSRAPSSIGSGRRRARSGPSSASSQAVGRRRTLNVLLTSQCFATTSCLDYNAWYIPPGRSAKLGKLWAQAAAKACYAAMEDQPGAGRAARARRAAHRGRGRPGAVRDMGMYGPCTGSPRGTAITRVLPVDRGGGGGSLFGEPPVRRCGQEAVQEPTVASGRRRSAMRLRCARRAHKSVAQVRCARSIIPGA